MTGKILIVDDERDMLVLLRRIISAKTSHEITTVDDPRQVVELLKRNSFDIVITDLKMPQLDGLQVLQTVKEKDESTAVVVMTAYGTIESAIEATRKGAFDYITKPFRKERILQVIEQAMKVRRLEKENLYLREKLEGGPHFSALIGNSLPMQRLHRQIDQVARTTATVLITGESGTGKELAARAVHALSRRRDKKFTAVNCSTIPEALIESELFGHVRGAFTGAVKDKRGLVEETNQGTLFLDEIGDLSLATQVKLLRLLQESEYKVIGENTIRKVDLRFIAATNQNLPEKIRKGEFREDLFYRLNVINIHMPPLRERREDIPVLTHHFMEKYNVLHGKAVARLSKEAIDYLMQQEWTGNVRELENVIERGVIMASGDMLQLRDLAIPDHMNLSPAESSGESIHPDEDLFSLPFKEAKDRLMDEFQARYLSKVLARHGGNVSQAAKDSGLKRQYLHRLMRETNVDSKAFKKPGTSEES